MKKFASLLLALVIVFSLAVPAAAAGTSKITIKPDSTGVTSIIGRSFAAYKILDAETIGEGQNTKYVYTVPAEWIPFFTSTDFFSNDQSGQQVPLYNGNEPDFHALVAGKIATLTSNSDELHAFASRALKYATENNIAASGTDTVEATETNAVIDGLDMGYYVIEDTTTDENLKDLEAVSALMLGTTDVDVTIKAGVTTVEKDIITGTNPDGSYATVKYTNGAIGDYVQFLLTSSVPDMYGYTGFKFNMVDTLSSEITYVEDSDSDDTYNMVVKVGGTTLKKIENATDYDPDAANNSHNVYTLTTYTLTEDDVASTGAYAGETAGSTVITIDFPFIFGSGWGEGAAITATYYGKINENAKFTSTGYPNEVEVEYSNKSNTNGNPTGTTPKKKVEVFTGEINLLKVDDAGKTLAGAIFTLEGEALNQSMVTSSVYTPADNGDWYKLNDNTYTQTAPTDLTKNSYEMKDATVSIENAKKYKLETTAKLVTAEDTTATDKITAEVLADGTLKFDGLKAGEYVLTEIKAPAGYNLLKKPIYVKLDVTITTDHEDWSATWNLYEGTENNGTVTYDTTKSLTDLKVVVENQAGTELPTTGGTGTTLFYVIGGGLMLAAFILLITKKRMAMN